MSESVSHWLPGLRAGDERATRRVWQRYFRRLVRLARHQLGGSPRSVSDEEDIALQALHSFFRRAQNGSFAILNNRDDLWRVLACITKRKSANQRRNCRTIKRSRTERGAVAVQLSVGESNARWYDAFKTPDELVALEETRQHMLGLLDDQELRAIAEAKLQGYTNVEIAARVRRSVPTVERRVRLIRQLWEQQGLDLR